MRYQYFTGTREKPIIQTRAEPRQSTSCAVPTAAAVNNRFSRFRRQHCRALDGGSGVGRRSSTLRRPRPSVVVPACTRPHAPSSAPPAGGRPRGICARAPFPHRHRHDSRRRCAAGKMIRGPITIVA